MQLSTILISDEYTTVEVEVLEKRWTPVILKVSRFRKIELPYIVSDHGEIKNRKGKILKPFLRGKKKGTYPCVDLCKDGERYRIDVHRLVALHYVENPEGKPEVNHLDCDHMNYNYKNLEWCTREENEQHKRFMEAHFTLALA